MPKSSLVISSIIRSIPNPMLVLDWKGRVILANSAAEDSTEVRIGESFAWQSDSPEKTSAFVELCRSSTTPLPSRLRLRNGFEGVAFGHRLVVPGARNDGAVVLRFDDVMNTTSRFAALNNDITSLLDRVRQFGHERALLSNLAQTDALTRILNRRGFDRELDREMVRSERYGHACCLALFDLDHFKAINDTHGHQLGDEVLIHFVHRCQEQIRSADILCRIGGEEFALILPETDLDQAAIVINRMLDLINSTPLVCDGRRYPYTASAGLSALSDVDTASSLRLRADRCLYAAKEAGRARLVCEDDTNPNGTEAVSPERIGQPIYDHH